MKEENKKKIIVYSSAEDNLLLRHYKLEKKTSGIKRFYHVLLCSVLYIKIPHDGIKNT